MRRVLALAILASIPLLLFGACTAIPASETVLGVWSQETALESGLKLGGCTVADIDPASDGAEVAVVRTDGAVLVLTRSEAGDWSARRVAELPGEAIQLAAGDLLSEIPGEELVTVGAATGGEDDGGPGAAWLLSTAADVAPRKIFEVDRLLHAVVVGDLDPARPGQEIMVAGYDSEAWLLYRDGGRWESLEIARLRAPAKGAALAKGGVVIGQTDGTLSLIRRDADGLWQTDHLVEHPAPLARLAGRGERVLYCSNDGSLRQVARGIPETVLEADDRLRGAVIADLLPAAGIEVATAGYDGTIRVAWENRLGWDSGIVGRDDDRFHHLACGELPGLGLSLVACGYSGRVIVVTPRAEPSGE